MSSEVTREDISGAVYFDDFDFDEFIPLISKHVNIQIPDHLRDPSKKEELINLVYDAVQEKAKTKKESNLSFKPKEEVEKEVEKDKPNDDPTPDPPADIKPDTPLDKKQFVDRKSHIIHLCKEGRYRTKEVVSIIDDAWGYSAEGRTSKTRVSKTIRDLKDSGLVRIDGDEVIVWRGE